MGYVTKRKSGVIHLTYFSPIYTKKILNKTYLVFFSINFKVKFLLRTEFVILPRQGRLLSYFDF